MEEVLAPMYRDPQLPGSFGGINALHRALKGRVRRKDIREWLKTKDSYTLHKPLRHVPEKQSRGRSHQRSISV